MVLLKNGKDSNIPFLPLEKNAKKILVSGTHADNLGYQCGGWTKTWDGVGGRITLGIYFLTLFFRMCSIMMFNLPPPDSLCHSLMLTLSWKRGTFCVMQILL